MAKKKRKRGSMQELKEARRFARESGGAALRAKVSPTTQRVQKELRSIEAQKKRELKKGVEATFRSIRRRKRKKK